MDVNDVKDVGMLLEEIRNRPKELIVEEKVDEETVKSLEDTRIRRHKTVEERVNEMSPEQLSSALFASRDAVKLHKRHGRRITPAYQCKIEEELYLQKLIYDRTGGPGPI